MINTVKLSLHKKCNLTSKAFMTNNLNWPNGITRPSWVSATDTAGSSWLIQRTLLCVVLVALSS